MDNIFQMVIIINTTITSGLVSLEMRSFLVTLSSPVLAIPLGYRRLNRKN